MRVGVCSFLLLWLTGANPLFIFSATDGHLGCFQFGTIMIKALGHSYVKVSAYMISEYNDKGFINISHIVLLFPGKWAVMIFE